MKKSKDGLAYYCKLCNSEYLEAYKIKRRNVINSYGGKCNCCGETVFEFLTIDHIRNNGNEHRKELKERGVSDILDWLTQNSYPKDEYQILCWNCNCGKAKTKAKICPHKLMEATV